MTTQKKQRNMPQLRGESVAQLTENHETLILKASEQAAFAKTVENDNSTSPTNESDKDRNSSSPLCREYSEPKKFSKFELVSSSFRSCQDWTIDWSRSIQICKNFGA